MKLYIDSRDNLRTVLMVGNEEFVSEYKSPREQDVLGSVSRSVAAKKIKLSNITQIEVAEGEGSFTGIRVGITVGNALGYALGLMVNGRSPLKPIEVLYGGNPNISKSKTIL